INIAPNGTATVTSTATWTPSIAGFYDVEIWLTDLNGNTVEMTSNDKVLKYVSVVDNYTVRYTLHEILTSYTCCTLFNVNKNTDETIFPQYPDQFTVIKYQMSWPGTGDPYCTSEGQTRRSLYGVNSIPNMQVDGGWNGNAGSYRTTDFDAFKAKPAFIDLSSKHTINFKKITVDVE